MPSDGEGLGDMNERTKVRCGIPYSGLERIRLLQIALHSAIRSTIILAILFVIQIAILMPLAIRLQSNTLSIVLLTHSTR